MPPLKDASVGFEELKFIYQLFANKEIGVLFPPRTRKGDLNFISFIHFMMRRLKMSYSEVMQMPAFDRDPIFEAEWSQHRKEIREAEKLEQQLRSNR